MPIEKFYKKRGLHNLLFNTFFVLFELLLVYLIYYIYSSYNTISLTSIAILVISFVTHIIIDTYRKKVFRCPECHTKCSLKKTDITQNNSNGIKYKYTCSKCNILWDTGESNVGGE